MHRRKTLSILLTLSIAVVLLGCELRSDQRTPKLRAFATEIVAPDRVKVLGRDEKYLDIKKDLYAFDYSRAKEIYLDDKLVGIFRLPKAQLKEKEFADFTGDGVHPTIPVFGKQERLAGYDETKLKDGRLFITGGKLTDRESPPANWTWFYDPSRRNFAGGPNLTAARAGHQNTLLRDGTILITGGEYPWYKPNVKEVELFDPKTNRIDTVCRLHVPRVFHRVVEIDQGKVLIISGQTQTLLHDAGDSLTSTVELIDLKNRECAVVGQLHNARTGFEVFRIGENDVLIVGGEMDGYFDNPHNSSVMTVELYRGSKAAGDGRNN